MIILLKYSLNFVADDKFVIKNVWTELARLTIKIEKKRTVNVFVYYIKLCLIKSTIELQLIFIIIKKYD